MNTKWNEVIGEDGKTVLDYAELMYKTGAPRRTIVAELNELLVNKGLMPTITYAALDTKIKVNKWAACDRINYLESINLTEKYVYKTKITSKCITVCNDLHIPFYKEKLLDKMLKVSEKFESNDLAVIGDLVDLTMISRFENTKVQQTLSQEFRLAARILDVLFEQFDTVYWCMGNHDVRFSKLTDGNFEPTDMGNIINRMVDGKRLNVIPYRHMEVNDKWRLTHPGSYSRIPPQVERRLAEKFHKHIIGSHGHLFGISTDISGDYITAQVGGLVDREKVWYRQETDTTHPEWVPGFWIIKNDVLYPFIDHPNLTDWDFWLK